MSFIHLGFFLNVLPGSCKVIVFNIFQLKDCCVFNAQISATDISACVINSELIDPLLLLCLPRAARWIRWWWRDLSCMGWAVTPIRSRSRAVPTREAPTVPQARSGTLLASRGGPPELWAGCSTRSSRLVLASSFAVYQRMVSREEELQGEPTDFSTLCFHYFFKKNRVDRWPVWPGGQWVVQAVFGR